MSSETAYKTSEIITKNSNEKEEGVCKLSFSWSSVLKFILEDLENEISLIDRYRIVLSDNGIFTETININEIFEFVVYDYLYQISDKGINDIMHIWNNRTFDVRNIIFGSIKRLIKSFSKLSAFTKFDICVRMDKTWFHNTRFHYYLSKKCNNSAYTRQLNRLINNEFDLEDTLVRLFKGVISSLTYANFANIKVKIIRK